MKPDLELETLESLIGNCGENLEWCANALGLSVAGLRARIRRLPSKVYIVRMNGETEVWVSQRGSERLQYLQRVCTNKAG